MAVISDTNAVKDRFLLPGDIISLLTSLISLPIIAVFFYQRLQNACHRNITMASVTLLMSYMSTFLFIFVLTTILHIRVDWDESLQALCDSTLMICLTLYCLTKATGFLFLIERAYIISWPVNPRHKTLEYVLSCFIIFVPYAVVTGLCIKYRIAINNGNHVCVIGMQMFVLVPLLLVEVFAYLYLTLRFLIPLIMFHRGGTGLLAPLRRVMLRTCIGTAITMCSTLAVKVSLTLFNGEPAWLCCMTCKIDALIAATVMHWITIPDPTNHGYEDDTPQALGVGFEKSTVHTSVSTRTLVPESPGEMDPKQIF
ncbi:hypothetical protein M409DRAFT_23785 [Zasmidium cellare ATCC 36951]|uniref:G-protein coupled receptors family 1 profile domain-containing protein n=1 Tax=Zasmidium cellare ATCC 36951 TaxID=1080233 RepID=A0A6A6CFP2_ZASCE|nr:uncharacterized protein M409DRAFT_23785 [Zasmidium cellare ATCC 36951]KAF2166057.1 hypothetical protein M409DRAFT_23785 [Zasmidium cellare ATCC 36951]